MQLKKTLTTLLLVILLGPLSVSLSAQGRYPEGSSRYLNAYDLAGKTKWELKIMRNEIYARHHYIFQSADLRNYFNAQAWYSGYYTDQRAVYGTFSAIEKKNVELIKSYENGSGSVSSYSGVPGRYPEGSTRYLGYDDIAYKSKWELKIMRNEIYARHGYIFKSSDLRNYFSRQSWYSGWNASESDVYRTFSAIEKANIQFIKSYE